MKVFSMQIFKDVITLINALVHLAFPLTCVACNKTLTNRNKIICIDCLHKLPRTDYHRIKNNNIEKIFYGSVNIQFATSFFHFPKKGLVKNMIHHLKYNNRQDVGGLFAMLIARDLKKQNLMNIDWVLGVPLHPEKEKKRGYNQLDVFASALAKEFNAEFSKGNLIKTVSNKSQTNKNREQRAKNVENIFDLLNSDEFTNKHILMVDDVLTTGATLNSCLLVLSKVEGIKLSVLTIAHGEL